MSIVDWSQVEVIILAAGLGTRLKPITEAIPKPTVPILGVPLIYWRLHDLASVGVKQVLMNSFHLSQQLISSVRQMANYLGLQIIFFAEDPILDSGGGILQILTQSKTQKKYALVFNGDNLLQINYQQVCNLNNLNNLVASLNVSDDWQRWFAYSCLNADVQNFLQDPQLKLAGLKPYHFYGVQLLNIKSWLSAAQAAGLTQAFGLLKLYYQPVLKNKIKMNPYGMLDWHDCGTVADLFALHWKVMQSLLLAKEASPFWAAWQDYYLKYYGYLPQIDVSNFVISHPNSQASEATRKNSYWTYWGPGSNSMFAGRHHLMVVGQDQTVAAGSSGKNEFWYQNKNIMA